MIFFIAANRFPQNLCGTGNIQNVVLYLKGKAQFSCRLFYLPLLKTVIEAMNYSVLAGGKRLRPMLMWETYRMFGGRSKVIEPFMAAIEMIHTYSLVHDDLPAMDNDEYRRTGFPSDSTSTHWPPSIPYIPDFAASICRAFPILALPGSISGRISYGYKSRNCGQNQSDRRRDCRLSAQGGII